ncbi:MAG: hypothetical protein GY920_21895, partial [Aliivibrio sp.]|nr:hypothetical protein [Aliivibrio sp.]
MYSGIPTQQPNEELEQEIKPVTNDPQPKSKREPVSRLANDLICLAGEAAQLMLQS